MRSLAIGVLVVTLGGCTFPVTRMEPVNPTDSSARHAADKKGSATANPGAGPIGVGIESPFKPGDRPRS
ncbi:MAG: hypothetical protein ACXVDD_19485 [Polyangia bacterium]